MAKGKGRPPVFEPGAATPPEAVVAVKRERPLRPSQCRNHLRKTLAKAFPEIVEGFIRQAKKGECQHLKMATEMVEPVRRVRAAKAVKGPARLLVEELEREWDLGGSEKVRG